MKWNKIILKNFIMFQCLNIEPRLMTCQTFTDTKMYQIYLNVCHLAILERYKSRRFILQSPFPRFGNEAFSVRRSIVERKAIKSGWQNEIFVYGRLDHVLSLFVNELTRGGKHGTGRYSSVGVRYDHGGRTITRQVMTAVESVVSQTNYTIRLSTSHSTVDQRHRRTLLLIASGLSLHFAWVRWSEVSRV